MNNKIVPRQCLEQIVEYVKTGQINIDPTNVWDLYLACDYCCIFFFYLYVIIAVLMRLQKNVKNILYKL